MEDREYPSYRLGDVYQTTENRADHTGSAVDPVPEKPGNSHPSGDLRSRHRKDRGRSGRSIPGIMAAALLFGVIAALAFRGTDLILRRFDPPQEKSGSAASVYTTDTVGESKEKAFPEAASEATASGEKTSEEQASGEKPSEGTASEGAASEGAASEERASEDDEILLKKQAEKGDEKAGDKAAAETGFTTAAPYAAAPSGTGTVTEVARAAMPSVVAITSVSIQEIPSFFGYYQDYASTGTGSGIIVGENDTELLIATNYHVVEDASTLNVCFIGNDVVSAGKEIAQAVRNGTGLDISGAVPASIRGSDPDNDLAVIAVEKDKIPDDTMSQIRIARLGDSDNLEVGEQVVAIGNALGYGQTVTSGWVSALERTVQLSSGSCAQVLQTDAAINPGNSGGALLNMKGEVIGINSAKDASGIVEGVGYAIPVSVARPILEKLMSIEPRTQVEDASQAGYLGVELADLTEEVQWMYNMPDGAFVTNVISGEAAADAGIQVNDIITKVDGQKISGRADLIDRLKYYRPGEEVTLSISRAYRGYYRELELKVTLGSR